MTKARRTAGAGPARIAFAALLIGAGLGLGWWLAASAPSVAAGVAPASVESADPVSAQRVSSLRQAVAAPEQDDVHSPESEPTAAEVATEDRPSRRQWLGGKSHRIISGEDQEAFTRLGLTSLEDRLTAEIGVSTADELRRRFDRGLGEYVGYGDDFDARAAWDHEVIMCFMSPGDGTHWRVTLPRDEYPEAYALWDRRAAVRAESESRRHAGERYDPLGPERNPNAAARE